MPPSSARTDPLPGAPAIPPGLQARLDAAGARTDGKARPRTRHLTADGRPRYTNRLILERSPYLRQHAHNPVSWFPWGDEAFQLARRLERPVLLSVGYSTCHWCHVMEEESFEDPEIAEYLNRHYVAIKVDREERPDVDEIYMTAVQAITGGGGWPMTVWLTPDREPFFGGTYFPPRAAHGRPGFLEILGRISAAFTDDRTRVLDTAGELAKLVRGALSPPSSSDVPGAADLKRALAAYESRFDGRNGGLRGRAKFPSSLPITLLLRGYRRTGEARLLEMARRTLDAMRRGGIHDQVGGGFHRYSVDPTWTVPHFEKMLYDNALGVRAYLEAYQVTGDASYAGVVRDLLEYVMREMTAPEGTFFTATDADSEGEEGRFFVWTKEELREAAGPELASLAVSAYGLTGAPNFEHRAWVLRRDASIGELARSHGLPETRVEASLAQIRRRLRAARARREPPLRDDKQLVAWNGLMISAFARAGLVLREPRFVEHGARAARFLLEHARPGGRLARYLQAGQPHGRGLLDDHAFLESALLDLFEATGEGSWLEEAVALQARLDARFLDDAQGGYWVSPDDSDPLLVREKPTRDAAVPSGNSVAAMNLLRLYTLTTDETHRVRAEMILRAFSDLLRDSPTTHARMLEALDFLLDRPREIVIVTPGSREQAEPFLRELARVYLPNRVLVVTAQHEIPRLQAHVPWIAEKKAIGDVPTAYVCEARVCDLPATSTDLFARQLRKKPRPW